MRDYRRDETKSGKREEADGEGRILYICGTTVLSRRVRNTLGNF